MDQNFADMIKDAFSAVDLDFEHLQLDGDSNASESQPTVDADVDLKDVSEVWTTSGQGSISETPSNIYTAEKNEGPDTDGSTDSSEEMALSNSPHVCPSQELNSDDDQAAENAASEEEHENQLLHVECTVEEESMHSDEETTVSMHESVNSASSILEEENDLSQEENIKLSLGSVENQEMQNEEHQQIPTALVFNENQTPEEGSSGSDEEGLGNCNIEQTHVIAVKPNMPVEYSDEDDLKEFTEEDQEGVKESLADYPSELFQSQSEEQNKSARDQPSALTDSSFGNDYSTNETENLSCVENFTTTDSDTEINQLEDQTTSEKDDIDASFQTQKVDEVDLQDFLTNDSSTEEGDAGNPNDQPDYDSDISSDHSTGQEEASFSSSVKHEEEWKTDVQQNNFIEDLGWADQDIGIETEDIDDLYSETDRDFPNADPISNREYCYEEPDEQSSELCSVLESVPPDRFIKEDDQHSLELLNCVTDTDTLNPVFISPLELPFGMTLDEGEDQEGTEVPEELDSDEDVEEKERDWEQEKTRIEAFYRFYGEQFEAEDQLERNHKVTFCLEHETSDYEEDSESSEQELDEVPVTPTIAVKPEYNSESDDEPQEKLFHPEKPKVRPKEQQRVDPSPKAGPPRSKCLAVLKSVLALGLMTVIGMVSFWWATDHLDWIH